MSSNGNGFREQSAVIPYRTRDGAVEVLLVTSLDTGRWVLPKGHIDDGLSARQSAEKEAFEEAGITGAVAKKSIGFYRYTKTDKKGGGLRRVEVYPMAVKAELDEWPEKDKRKRRWMHPGDAARLVAEKKLGKILQTFSDLLDDLKAAG